MNRIGILIAILMTSFLVATADADEHEIRDLYAKVTEDIDEYIQITEQNVRRFEERHSGRAHALAGLNAGASQATGGKDVYGHLAAAINARATHAANLALIGKVDNWVGKMRIWADDKLMNAATAAWQSTVLITYYDIRSINARKDEPCEAQKPVEFEGEDPGSAYNYYADTRKYDPILSRNLEKRYSVTADAYEKLEDEYDQIGRLLGTARGDFARKIWPWVHYYEDLSTQANMRPKQNRLTAKIQSRFQSDRAKAMQDFLSYRIGMQNSVRRGANGQLLGDSDLSWYISYPGSEDRFHNICTVQVYAKSRQYDFFHKLNDYVNEPEESFDDLRGSLAGVGARGSRMERLAQILSRRLVQYYQTEEELERLHVRLKTMNEEVPPLLSRLEGLGELEQAIQSLRYRLIPSSDIAREIQAQTEKIEEIRRQKDRSEQAYATEADAVKKAGELRTDVYIMPDNRGGWRALNAGETGVKAVVEADRISRSIQNFEDALRTAERSRAEAAGKDVTRFGRAEQDIRRFEAQLKSLRRELELVNSFRTPPPPDRTRLEQLEAEGRSIDNSLVDARDRLAVLTERSRSPGGELPGDSDTDVQKVRADYETVVRDMKQVYGDVPGVSELDERLTYPNVDAQRFQAQLTKFPSVASQVNNRLREDFLKAKFSLDATLGRVKVLDQRMVILAMEVTKLRERAAALVAEELVQSGAREEDPVVLFMAEFRKAVADGKKILDYASKPLETARDEALKKGETATAEKFKADQFGKQVLGSGNKVLKKLIDVPDLPGKQHLAKLNQHLQNANDALGNIDKLAKVLENGAKIHEALKGSENPTLTDAFNYLNVVLAGMKEMDKGSPVGSTAWGSYVDYLSYSVKSIQRQAEAIQEAALQRTIKFNSANKPERHLYFDSEIETAGLDATINASDRWRLLKVLQIRRLVALMSARNLQEACNRPLTRQTCENLY